MSGRAGALRLLDLFSGAGGCARGYQMAGFHVTGVDIKPQPRYAGDEFHQADALEFVREHGHEFDAIHASPPCQAYTLIGRQWTDRDYPALVEPTRRSLIATGRPYVIENVVSAPVKTTILLCGVMFGLKVYRHRLFESNVMIFSPPHTRHRVACGIRGKIPTPDQFVVVTGNMTQIEYFARAQDAMGIDWMNRREIAQAIPPAFTEHIGRQLMQAICQEAAV